MASRIHTYRAIILKRTNYRETDRTVTAFTAERGKYRFVARGVRKLGSRRAPFIEPLSIVKITVNEGNGTLPTLTEAVSDLGRSIVIPSLAVASALYFIAELIDRLLPEGESHERVFQFVRSSISEIAETPDRELGEKLSAFTSILLAELGFIAPGKTYPTLLDAAAAVEAVSERKLHIRRFLRYIPE